MKNLKSYIGNDNDFAKNPKKMKDAPKMSNKRKKQNNKKRRNYDEGE